MSNYKPNKIKIFIDENCIKLLNNIDIINITPLLTNISYGCHNYNKLS